jgi:transposase InsO family protein
MRIIGIDKSLYMITLVDNYSRMTLVRDLAQKSNAEKELLAMIAIMERKGEAKVEMIQTDNGGEYRSTELLEELKKKGITIKQTVPYHSQTNPVAERINRMIITMARTALLQNSNNNAISRYLWMETIQHSAYTKNRTPHCTLGGKSLSKYSTTKHQLLF